MNKREKLREIFSRLKFGEYLCEMYETKNLIGEVVGYGQGVAMSMDWNGHWSNSYIYFSHYGHSAKKATLENLKWILRDSNLDNIVSDTEFKKKSGKDFFYWGI